MIHGLDAPDPSESKWDDYDSVEVEGKVLKISDNAILFDNGDVQAWIPKSQIEDYDEGEMEENEGEMVEISIPEWLATEKDLI